MQRKAEIRYSQAFKRQVVADLESGRFGSIRAASRHYGIRGSGTSRGCRPLHLSNCRCGLKA